MSARTRWLLGALYRGGPVLQTITGIDVYNTSRLTLRAILADPAQVAGNLRAWIAAFDPDAQGSEPTSRPSIARRGPRALTTVSCHSAAGSLRQVIPPPT